MTKTPEFLVEKVNSKGKKTYQTPVVQYGDVSLKKHQVFPAYYLKYLFPEQKGLLLNHLMGTGKTISGLHFMMEFKEYNRYLVCPRSLIQTWLNEMSRLGVDSKTIHVVAYEDFYEFTKMDEIHPTKSVIVMDEAHLLVEKLRYHYDGDITIDVLAYLQKFHKILLMTGTPFYNDFYDVTYLINIASGKDTLPYNAQEFNKKYFSISPIKSAVYGWLFPILDTKLVMLGTIASHQILLQHGISFLHVNDTSVSIPKPNQEYVNYPQSDFDTVSMNYAFAFLKAMGFLASNSVYGAILIIFPIVLLLSLMLNIFMDYDLHRIRSVNVKKLAKDTQQYISVFEPKHGTQWLKKYQTQLCHSQGDNFLYRLFCKKYLKELETSDFPVYEISVRKTEYTEAQYQFFLRFCYNQMTDEDMFQIGIDETMAKVKMFGYQKTSQNDVFSNKGRAIGNLILKHEKEIQYPKKFMEIIEMSKGKQTVIYSSFFHQGIRYFANCLKVNDLEYEILDIHNTLEQNNTILKRFADREVQYLLIHPDYFQGINIIGAEQLHILEPIHSHPKLEQIYYRVIRYRSHTHLPAKDRKVSIYVWVTQVLPYFKRQTAKVKAWAKYSPEVVYWKRLAQFNQDFSPDSIVYEQMKRQKDIFEDFKQYLKNKSIENCSRDGVFTCDMPVSLNDIE